MENKQIPSSKRWKELNAYKDGLSLSSEQFEVLVGCLLGDLYCRKIGKNCRMAFEQKNKDYLYHLKDVFTDFVRTAPKERVQQRLATSEMKSTWFFSTISHPEFHKLWALFYETGDHIKSKNGQKRVPKTLFKHLTARSLAYWFMDDGTLSRHTIFTCSFTLAEHEFLIAGLKDKFDLEARLVMRGKFPVLVFNKENGDKLENLIRPYIVPSMMYKLSH